MVLTRQIHTSNYIQQLLMQLRRSVFNFEVGERDRIFRLSLKETGSMQNESSEREKWKWESSIGREKDLEPGLWTIVISCTCFI